MIEILKALFVFLLQQKYHTDAPSRRLDTGDAVLLLLPPSHLSVHNNNILYDSFVRSFTFGKYKPIRLINMDLFSVVSQSHLSHVHGVGFIMYLYMIYFSL